MADNIIDELQLKVGANASEAINNLGRLQTQLRHLARSMGAVTSSAAGMDKAFVSLKRLDGIKSNNLALAITQLERLSKIDLSNIAGKKLDLDVHVSGVDKATREVEAAKRAITSINSKEYADKLASMFDIKNAGAIKTLREQFQTILGNMYDARNNGGSYGIDNQTLFGTLLHEGQVAKSSFDFYIESMQDRYKEFLDYVNKNKFYIMDSSIETNGTWEKGFFESGMQRYFTRARDKGIDLNSVWEELTQNVGGFKDVFDSVTSSNEPLAETLVNTESQAQRLAETILRVKDAMSSVAADSVKWDQESFDNVFTGPVRDLIGNMGKEYDSVFQKAMKENANKIPLDIVINEASIADQIDRAVQNAAKKTYEFPIKLQLGKQNIQFQVAEALKEIDPGNLGTMGEKIQGLAKSLVEIGDVNTRDSGINSFVNAIRRLTEVDLSKFNTGVLHEIIGTISSVSQMGDISGSINRLVSSLARLANAGEKTGQSATALPRLNSALREVITGISSAGGVSAELNAFVGAIAQLANAGNRTGATATQLESLGTAIRDFMASLQNAPEVSQNVVQIVQATAQLASSGAKAGSAAKGIGKSISSIGSGDATARIRAIVGVLGELVKICEKAGGIVKSAVTKIISGLKSLKTPGNGIRGITENIRNMVAAMIGFRGITGLASFVKETVQMGAALTEIDHIVESVFGNLSGYVDDWAKNAITNFGIAEQSAKQYAGVLSSMFQASGVGYQDAGKMGMDLVELAGDLSAFYNIDTETAYNKIRSGMAGMVRPLRDLGIDLTAATLEEFRLSQGIETAYKSMSQAEKVMLRYRYLMANTTTQQGDFALGMIA